MKSLQKFLDSIPTNTTELIDYDGQEFYNWQGEKLGNDLFISDPDRAARIHDAAAEGCDGSTHAERIEDFREYAGELFDRLQRRVCAFDFPIGIEEAILDYFKDKKSQVEESIDDCEAWHEKNGSLDQQCG